MKIRERGQRMTIRGICEITGYSPKDVIYFMIELSAAIILCKKKGEEEGKDLVTESLKVFLENEHGIKIMNAMFELWEAGGEAHKQMKN